MTLTQERDGLVVRTERLDLPLLPLELLDALIDGDRAAVGRIAPYTVPREFPGGQAELIDGKGELLGFLRFRRDQLRRDPERYPWSLRAIVHRVDQRMTGS